MAEATKQEIDQVLNQMGFPEDKTKPEVKKPVEKPQAEKIAEELMQGLG